MDAPSSTGGVVLESEGSHPDQSPAPGLDVPGRLTVRVEKKRVRRTLTRRYWAIAAAGPLLVTAALATLQAPGLEQAVAANAEEQLEAPKFDGVRLEVDGRHVTAMVPVGTRTDQVEKAVASADGVASVLSRRGFASGAEKRACDDLQGKVDRATDQQSIPFDGTSARLTSSGVRMVEEVASLLEACGPAVAVVGGHADSGVSDAAALSLQRARAIAAELQEHGVADDRIQTRGYGDEFPLSTTDAAQNHRGSISARVS